MAPASPSVPPSIVDPPGVQTRVHVPQCRLLPQPLVSQPSLPTTLMFPLQSSGMFPNAGGAHSYWQALLAQVPPAAFGGLVAPQFRQAGPHFAGSLSL